MNHLVYYVCNCEGLCSEQIHATTCVLSCVQLIAAGVLDKKDYPNFNEETGILPPDDDPGSDEDIEVELVEEEPTFLRGQTKLTISHSPVRIVKVRIYWCVWSRRIQKRL